MIRHLVQVKKYEDDSVVIEIECKSQKDATQVADGIDILLDHDHENYYTEVIEKGEVK